MSKASDQAFEDWWAMRRPRSMRQAAKAAWEARPLWEARVEREKWKERAKQEQFIGTSEWWAQQIKILRKKYPTICYDKVGNPHTPHQITLQMNLKPGWNMDSCVVRFCLPYDFGKGYTRPENFYVLGTQLRLAHGGAPQRTEYHEPQKNGDIGRILFGWKPMKWSPPLGINTYIALCRQRLEMGT